MRFHAWHLPDRQVREVRTLVETAEGLVVTPVLSREDVAAIARQLSESGARLHELGTDRIVAAIDHVARRLAEPDDALRAEALRWIPAVTGYSPPMAAEVLDRMAADWHEPALRRLLRAELRDVRVLDAFVPHAPGQRVRAVPPRLVLHILAGNVPGVGVTSLVRSLLVRAPALCKVASGEPILTVLFARALAEHEPAMADAFAVTYWQGGDAGLEAAALRHADAVVHYGSAAALADLRGRLPAGVRLLDHGPRVSFAAIARERAGHARAAHDAARAIAVFDQQGCVSPHIVYIEQGGRVDARTFAARLAAALDRLALELPRGLLSTAEAGLIQQLRGAIEFRSIAGEAVQLWAGEDLAYTVVFDPDPAFTTACLNRTVWVKPLPDLSELITVLRPHAALLQSAALDAPRNRRNALAEQLAFAGVTRITSTAAAPWPPSSWHHDGRGPLRELLHFADLETDI